MLYNVVLVFTIQQHESAVSIHVPPPLGPPSRRPIPPLQVITEPQAELPGLHSGFPSAVYVTRGSVYISALLSLLVPPSSPPAISVLNIKAWGFSGDLMAPRSQWRDPGLGHWSGN